MNIIDLIRQRAGEQPDKAALISGEREAISYRELIERMDTAASRMRAAGARPYDRCGLHAENGAGFIIHGLAVMASGQCLVPVSDDYGTPALEEFVRRVSLHRLVHDVTNDGFALAAFPDALPVDGAGDRDFQALDPAFIRFTSGTTNRRKGVVIGHRAIVERITAANTALQIDPDDVILWLLPMAHHWVVSILLYLRYGATILLPSSSDVSTNAEWASANRVTVMYASPQHYDDWIAASDVAPSLRLAVSTASGLSEAVAARFMRRTGRPLVQALGIIEVGLPVINTAHADRKPMSVGQVLADYHVTLKPSRGENEDDPESDSGVGEICVAGPGLFDAYLSPWVPAAAVVQPEGFRTGDLGYFDDEGDLYVLGRRLNRISLGGVKFFCEEVEAVLDTHPGIAASRVRLDASARPPRVVADIVPRNGTGPSHADLLAHCGQALSRHKIPSAFYPVDELPRTATGKIRRW